MILARCLKDRAKPITVEIETKDGVRSVERARFGLHLVLSEIHKRLDEALEDPEHQTVWGLLRHYFELATGFEVDCVGDFAQFAQALLLLWTLNSLFVPPPFLKGPQDLDKPERSLPWDYEGRATFLMVHVLARTYGWSLDQVVNLEPEVGLALVNEILVDEQLQQEWDYGLSEVARVYNPTTKRSHFKPLPRPPWMAHSLGTLKTKIPKSVLPQGHVIDVQGKKVS